MINDSGEFVIDRLNAEQRLDKFLARLLNRAPKSFIYRMLREKRVKLNGRKADGGVLLREGDVVKFYLSRETMENLCVKTDINTTVGEVDVVYEDENVLVVNKPAGVLTHGDKKNSPDTLTDRVHSYAKNTSVSPANRLDRNTSGLVVFGKNLPSMQWLAKAFRERNVEKYYIAVVSGILRENMTISANLLKDNALNKVSVCEHGKPSVTAVLPIQWDEKNNRTVLKIRLITGRTHQIRAHLASIGFPIIGDGKYAGAKSGEGMMLHAHELIFTESGGFLSYLSGQVFSAPPPVIPRPPQSPSPKRP